MRIVGAGFLALLSTGCAAGTTAPARIVTSDIEATFAESSALVRSERGAAAIHLARIGRRGAMVQAAAGAPHTVGARVEIARGEYVTEWFTRDDRGLEQGVDIAERPRGDGELVLEISADGVVPELSRDSVTLRDAHGEALFSYGGLFVKDVQGRAISARLGVADGRIALHIDDRDAQYPLVVDPLIYALRATISGPTGVSNFARRVALKGTTLAVTDSNGVSFYTGAATTWAFQTRFAGGFLGTAVAVSDNYAVVGANGSGMPAAVTFYANIGGVWSAAKTFGGWVFSSNFGDALALTEPLAIVGAPNAAISTSLTGAGTAAIYALTAGTWAEQARITAKTPRSNEQFGAAVAISGATALVGVTQRDIAGKTRAGAVDIFEQSGATWTNTGQITAPTPSLYEGFGRAIALGGDTVIVGGSRNAAYVFVRGAAGWTAQATLESSDTADTDFGDVVAIDGDRAVVGSARAITLFVRSGTAWSQTARLPLTPLANAVAFSADTIAAASGGTVRIYGPASSNGDGCTKNGDCADLMCVDGVCCSSACTETCKSCNNAYTGQPNGTCALVTDGKDPGGDCVSSGSVCTGGSVTNQVCNGSGSCRLSSISCAPFMCTSDGKGCASACTTDTECSAAQYCSATGVCTTRFARGEACKEDRECTSRYCVDGVCCDTKCDGQCQACAEPGSVGSCVPVKGSPRTPRAACSGTDVACAGTCDGTNLAACSYPSAGRTCGAGCKDAAIAVCDATGACLEATPCPGSYVCDGPTNKCKTSCVADSECTTGFVCDANKCVPKPAPPPVRCSDDRTASIAPDGKETRCAPYKCGSDGACPSTCATSADCLEGSCDVSRGAGVCVPLPAAEDDGGCAVGHHRARSAAVLGLAVLAALGLIRRARSSRSSTP